MASPTFHCCEPRRLEVLRERAPGVNAIEFVEVLDQAAPPGVPRQRTLLVRLLRPGFTLGRDNVRISGGERIRDIGVVWAAAADALPAEAEPGLAAGIDVPERTLVVRTDREGDFSRYTLALVAGAASEQAPGGFDPVLSRIGFAFKVECPSDFDCAEARSCPPEAVAAPVIDYLAKDYPTLRRLMLDRLSLLVPDWRERSAADLGVVLVELLAYAADNLSYRQDAIANEAYLATARRRSSVRRHARLVDYRLHEGCNARVWVQVNPAAGSVDVARGTQLLTRSAAVPRVLKPRSRELQSALDAGSLVFEVARTTRVHVGNGELRFHAWGDEGCCLPRGTTEATLRGRPPLGRGDVLVLQEIRCPTVARQDGATDAAMRAEADRTRRWAVRLVAVTPDTDPSGRLFDPRAPGEPAPADPALQVTRIAWDAADALPFALCLGVAERPGLPISVALGNMVLADHGRRLDDELLAPVPAPSVAHYAPASRPADACAAPQPEAVPLRYRPTLAEAPLTHGFDLAALLEPLPGDPQGRPFWPARLLLPLSVREAMPRIALATAASGEPATWEPQPDLLGSRAADAHFVVETEHDRRSRLRFGDDDHGRRPDAGTVFQARYRIGNGSAGNVGAQAIAHLVLDDALYGPSDLLPGADDIAGVLNPMPAAGGVDPEDVEAARRDAPEAFRTQERAVTPADYAAAAERSAEVQRAAASFRWTGSWHTVFVTADRFGGGEVDAPFEARLRRHLERFRMAGYDLEVDAPRLVPLDVELHLCVKPGYFRAEVVRAVREVLSDRLLPDGRRGVFHPDAFSFGEPVYLSRIVAAAQAVPGVDAVRADRFGRMVGGNATSLAEGVVRMGRLEIAQLANDPNFRERGRLALTAGGGQ